MMYDLRITNLILCAIFSSLYILIAFRPFLPVWVMSTLTTSTALSKTHRIKFFHKKLVAFKMTFENSNSTITEQLCEFITNNEGMLRLQKRDALSFDGYVLVDESNMIISNFSSLPTQESQLTFYVPERISAVSGSEWTIQYLNHFNIEFHMITADQFCNSHEMSATARGLINTLGPVTQNHSMSYPKRNSSVEDFEAARNN